MFRAIATTFALTSLLWFGVFAWWTRSERTEPGPTIVQKPTKPQEQKSAQIVSGEPRAPLTPGPQRRDAPGRLFIPVSGIEASELVDTFTQARAGGARRHDAIDIMAPRGTPVIAAAPGTVEKLFLSDDGGKTVYVRSTDRELIYYYAHLDRYARGLEEGNTLATGDPIGTVGYSGNADPAAPHLHFEVMDTAPDREWYQDKTSINPYPLLTGRN